MKARFTSIAELELKEAMEFYEAAQAGLGGEFLAEVEATTRLIENHPQAWFALSPRTRRAGPIGSPTAYFIRCALMKS